VERANRSNGHDYMMTSMNVSDYQPGECPLSKDGICEADDACPYGCDEKLEQESKDDRINSELVWSVDPVSRLLEYLKARAWFETFKSLSESRENPLPSIVDSAHERMRNIERFLDGRDFVRAKIEWDEFWKSFREDSADTVAVYHPKLYRKYHRYNGKSN
jgi:hypothetical protein